MNCVCSVADKVHQIMYKYQLCGGVSFSRLTCSTDFCQRMSPQFQRKRNLLGTRIRSCSLQQLGHQLRCLDSPLCFLYFVVSLRFSQCYPTCVVFVVVFSLPMSSLPRPATILPDDDRRLLQLQLEALQDRLLSLDDSSVTNPPGELNGTCGELSITGGPIPSFRLACFFPSTIVL